MILKSNMLVDCQEHTTDVECSMYYGRGMQLCPQPSGKAM
jgi:hypothetical protein